MSRRRHLAIVLRAVGSGALGGLISLGVCMAVMTAAVGTPAAVGGVLPVLLALLIAVIVVVAAATGGAVGAWQAAAAGASSRHQAAGLGAFGPGMLGLALVLAHVDPGPLGLIIAGAELTVLGGAAVLGAWLLSRRLSEVPG